MACLAVPALSVCTTSDWVEEYGGERCWIFDDDLIMSCNNKFSGVDCGMRLRSVRHLGSGEQSVQFKAAPGPGVATNFYLASYDFFNDRSKPWCEVDFDILGSQITPEGTKIWTNFITGQGTEHTKQIEVPFDASADYHTYTIATKNYTLKWLVDGVVYRSEDIRWAHDVVSTIDNWQFGAFLSLWGKSTNEPTQTPTEFNEKMGVLNSNNNMFPLQAHFKVPWNPPVPTPPKDALARRAPVATTAAPTTAEATTATPVPTTAATTTAAPTSAPTTEVATTGVPETTEDAATTVAAGARAAASIAAARSGTTAADSTTAAPTDADADTSIVGDAISILNESLAEATTTTASAVEPTAGREAAAEMLTTAGRVATAEMLVPTTVPATTAPASSAASGSLAETTEASSGASPSPGDGASPAAVLGEGTSGGGEASTEETIAEWSRQVLVDEAESSFPRRSHAVARLLQRAPPLAASGLAVCGIALLARVLSRTRWGRDRAMSAISGDSDEDAALMVPLSQGLTAAVP